MKDGPGRSCPLRYRYDPGVLASEPSRTCDVLYVVGGLYGNTEALARVLDLFAAEEGDKVLVFNGDFNWFNVESGEFERVNRTVLEFGATRGNVETEIALPDDGAGCGCAYPDWVDDGIVERSNEIIRRLRATAIEFPSLTRAMAALPAWMRVDVGEQRVAIVHGDAESLAGWGFAQEALRDPRHQERLDRWFRLAEVDVFASTHTCLPALHKMTAAGDRAERVVINNGAAGLPNFAGTTLGLITRIAVRSYRGDRRCFGVESGGVSIDAIGVDYDQPAWQRRFLMQWPPGSPAFVSYWTRIVDGPRCRPEDIDGTPRRKDASE